MNCEEWFCFFLDATSREFLNYSAWSALFTVQIYSAEDMSWFYFLNLKSQIQGYNFCYRMVLGREFFEECSLKRKGLILFTMWILVRVLSLVGRKGWMWNFGWVEFRFSSFFLFLYAIRIHLKHLLSDHFVLIKWVYYIR